VNTKAALLALEQIGGDLSDNGEAYRTTLASLQFETPTGMVKLDHNRNAIADMFLTQVVEGPDGNLLNEVVKVIPQVNQTLGMPEAEFLAIGEVSRDNPDCQ
jgi:branched-chain amino acid transport system substrate-binding protein